MARLPGPWRVRLSKGLDHLFAVVSAAFPPGPQWRPRLGTLRARLLTAQPEDPLIRVLSEFARACPEATFMQIGANDGDKGDYLQDYVRNRWRGVLVEPIPYVFASLAGRYGGCPRLTLVNAAVTDHDGTATLYYLPKADSDDLPYWYDALATFRKDVLLKHEPWIPDIGSRIATIEVRALTFGSLCADNGIEHVDLIQIDTEGYDFEIIRQIDLDRYRPLIVLYEHFHLAPDERQACELHLREKGYICGSNYMDTLAVRADGKLGRRLAALLQTLDDGQFSVRQDG